MTTPQPVVNLALQSVAVAGSPSDCPFEISVEGSLCRFAPHVEVGAGVGVFGGELFFGGEVDLGPSAVMPT